MHAQDIVPALARFTAAILGLGAAAAGIRSILKPEPFAESFGLPQSRLGTSKRSDSRLERNAFIPVVGVRNIATGLSILTFSLQNETRTTGIILLCNLAAMIGDTVICYRSGTMGSERSHLVASLIFALLGGWMALQ